MWEDELENEEYERLTYDYDYPEYSSSTGADKHSAHKSHAQYDSLVSSSVNKKETKYSRNEGTQNSDYF